MLISQIWLIFLLSQSFLNSFKAFLSKPHVTCHQTKKLKMISWMNNFENMTREDLVKYNYDLTIDKKINNELSLLLDNKLSAFKTDIKADMTAFKTDIKADITAFKTDIKADMAVLETKLSALENYVTPLTVIYTILVASLGTIGTFLIMIFTKINWSNIIK